MVKGLLIFKEELDISSSTFNSELSDRSTFVQTTLLEEAGITFEDVTGSNGSDTQELSNDTLIYSVSMFGPGILSASKLSAAVVRSNYLSKTFQLGLKIDDMKAAGKSAEYIVRTVSPARNALKMEMRKQGSWITARLGDIRNLIKYKNRAGPTPEQLLKEYGSWEKAMQAITRTDPVTNKMLGF
ncbi:MAG: hypothetical protein CSA81_04725 [Acidobacteria bacterium]|nr:MAG: hypothetical protein CSA81_04725 [Acidobacteriota bacterium]